MLTDIDFPEDLSYSFDSEHKPLEFYLKCLSNSQHLDLRLGYFSTSAIRVLSLGFARFIYKGGTMRIITNHYLSDKDIKLLDIPQSNDDYNYKLIESVIKKDVKRLEKIIRSGEKHFFNCLRFLLDSNRLVITPVKMSNDKMSHYKQGIFSDGKSKVYFNGSCNFTYSGIVENGENIELKRSWGASPEKLIIDKIQKKIDSIINKSDKDHKYLTPSEVVKVINERSNSKELSELVQDELKLFDTQVDKDRYTKTSLEVIENEYKEFKNWIKSDLDLPIFPYSQPHNYQKIAYKNWVKNSKKGLFAMATGTGKTVTALNCLLNEYNISDPKKYRALILVPTLPLLDQWKAECLDFNFKNLNIISSKKDWQFNINTTLARAKRVNNSFIIICTYKSLVGKKFKRLFNNFPKDTVLIADEVHNLGATTRLEVLDDIKFEKRIGLSATPERYYDDYGTEKIQEFFHDTPPYVISYNMKKAIEDKSLCSYYYYPHIVKLTYSEFEQYLDISKKIGVAYNIDPESSNLQRLYRERKNIIHQAENKLPKTIEILRARLKKHGNLKYTFVYVPEGFDENKYDQNKTDYSRFINQYMIEIDSISPDTTVNKIVGNMENRQVLLNQFEEGYIQVLTSMKCLDEGVDIPRAECAIFCSSTGNPKQYIQRRGRVLRKHDDKDFATIHDLVVCPMITNSDSSSFNSEKRLIENELHRVIRFAKLAKNKMHVFDIFEDICNHYDINIYKMFNSISYE